MPVSLGVRFAGVAATEAMDGSFRLVPRPTLRGRFSDSPKVAAVNASASARALARSSKYGTDESSKNCIELRVYKVQLDFNGPSATNGIPELLKSMVRPQPLSGALSPLRTAYVKGIERIRLAECPAQRALAVEFGLLPVFLGLRRSAPSAFLIEHLHAW